MATGSLTTKEIISVILSIFLVNLGIILELQINNDYLDTNNPLTYLGVLMIIGGFYLGAKWPRKESSTTTKSTTTTLVEAPINNTYVWLLAFAPLIGSLTQGFISGAILASNSTTLDNPNFFFKIAEKGSILWWIPLALNIILCLLDERKLKLAGYNTKSFGGLWIILIPVYLFKRANYLKQTPSYAWAWIVVFILFLLF